MCLDLKTIETIINLPIISAIFWDEAKFLYDVVKQYKPEFVIETGSGKSSLAILKALQENESGELHSIDLPNLEGQRSFKSNKDTTKKLWKDILNVYPQWDIREKNICTELPLLLQEIPAVDIFFHDSRHTESHIFLEWAMLMASGKLVKGSLFGMHDRQHHTYKNFIRQLKENPSLKSIGYCHFLEIWEVI